MVDEKGTQGSDLAAEARKGQASLVREFAGFLMSNKKFWLAPIIVLLLVAALVIFVAGTAAGSWLYAIW